MHAHGDATLRGNRRLLITRGRARKGEKLFIIHARSEIKEKESRGCFDSVLEGDSRKKDPFPNSSFLLKDKTYLPLDRPVLGIPPSLSLGSPAGIIWGGGGPTEMREIYFPVSGIVQFIP